MRKIAVIAGSKSDLRQCLEGLEYLKNNKDVEIQYVYIRSQHRNTLEAQVLLQHLSKEKFDCIITGAGWANHLSGCSDAYLRYTLQDNHLVVIGVAFEVGDEKRDNAARLSISEVPGTQVIYKDEGGQFFGAIGFLRACRYAATRQLPIPRIPDAKPIGNLTLDEAIELASH